MVCPFLHYVKGLLVDLSVPPALNSNLGLVNVAVKFVGVFLKPLDHAQFTVFIDGHGFDFGTAEFCTAFHAILYLLPDHVFAD